MLKPIGKVFNANYYTRNSIATRKPIERFKSDTVSFGCKNLQYEPDFLEIYDKYCDFNKIEKIASSDKNINEILNSHGIPLVVNKSLKYNQEFTEHIRTTYLTAIAIGKLEGLSKGEIESLGRIAIVHDIGKFLIPKEILYKKGELNSSEREIMNTHATLGALILKKMNMSEREILAVNYHHGAEIIKEDKTLMKQFKGYKEDQLCEILKIADQYSALTTDRCYRKHLNAGDAFKIMRENAKSGLIKNSLIDLQEKIVSGTV